MGRRGLSATAAVLVALASSSARAADDAANESGSRLTLAEAVALAQSRSYESRIAALERGRAGDVADQRRGTFLPQFFAVSQAGYSNRMNDKLYTQDPNGTIKRYGLATLGSESPWIGIYVDQILFDLEQRRLLERDELAAEAARIAEAEERNERTIAVFRSYANVVRQEELVRRARQAQARAAGLDERAETLYRAGRALRSDRELAAIQLEAAGLQARAQEAEAEIAVQGLWQALGGGNGSGERIEVDSESLPDPTDNRPVDTDAAQLRESPELRILALRHRMEEVSVEAARAGRLPTLKLRTGYNNYGGKRYDNFQDEVFVAVDLRVPFFDGFQTSNAVDGALKTAEIARLRYESALRAKQGRVRQLGLQLEAADGRVELARRRVASAQEKLRIADANLRAERGSLEQALGAREQLARDAGDAVQIEFERLDLWAALLNETGALLRVIQGESAAAEPAAAAAGAP